MAPRRFALIGVIALACGESSVTPLGAPELVLSEIRLGGADRVSRRIDSDIQFGRTVMDGIASGDSLWLEVARSITPKSAAAEASFVIALAAALPQNTPATLSLLDEPGRASDVCSIPFVETSAERVSSYYDSASAALERVTTPSLAPLARSCATALAVARDRKLERIDPAYVIKNKPAPPRPATRRRSRR